MAQLIAKFYSYLQEEVAVRQAASEEGDTQEQAFTRIAAEMLSEAGEVEGVTVAYDEKEIGKKGQHKINGYAIADDYETLDLFISISNRCLRHLLTKPLLVLQTSSVRLCMTTIKVRLQNRQTSLSLHTHWLLMRT